MTEVSIPEDIMEAANACFLHGLWDEVTGNPVITRDLVARALLAEREACAKIASAEADRVLDNEDAYPFDRVHDFLVVARRIAKAIRRR